ncbi:hypothetical protein BZM27_39635 [Paraburkholderia steynii]|uniref:Uncharacterized protein n=1 Tax=Paraburkholderia steynii TaxID=1245441 RepID=A0A4R0X3Z9_9BURK|nr:hypothetical protein BZM27_39635 [Paraburkholderia steynii]
MTTESQAEFARRCGVSRKTVTAWKKAGRLVLQGDKVEVAATIAMLNKNHKGGSPVVTSAVTLPVTQASEGNNVGNGAGNGGGNTVAKESRGASARKPGFDEIEVQPGESIEQAAERIVGEIDMNMSFDEARRLKEVYLVLLNRLEFEQKSGALVDLDTASGILFEEFRAARDAWLNWPARIGPMLAADLSIDADKLTGLLTGYVHKQISSLGEPQADFSAAL